MKQPSPPNELTTTRGIPVTTPARTLLDLATVVGPQALERAINEAEVLRLTSPHSLDDLVNRHRGRPGIPAMSRILNAGSVGATITRNEMEDRFFALLDEAGLPRPEVNAQLQIAGTWIEPDFMWPSSRLIVELDGYETHGTRAAFERDRARDRALQVAGCRVCRVTWRQLHERPAAVVSELSDLLRDPYSSTETGRTCSYMDGGSSPRPVVLLRHLPKGRSADAHHPPHHRLDPPAGGRWLRLQPSWAWRRRLAAPDLVVVWSPRGVGYPRGVCVPRGRGPRRCAGMLSTNQFSFARADHRQDGAISSVPGMCVATR